jgi:hypothetical protein
MTKNISRRTVLAFGTLTAAELWLGKTARAADTPFAFRDIGATGTELSQNGRPVFVYNHGMVLADGFPKTMQRSSYLHPVYAPDGTVLTDDFNADHPHHRGISWMWPEVSVDGKKGDMWALKGLQNRFIRWCARETAEGTARLAVENGWFHDDRLLVKEKVDILVHAASGNRRTLEFTLSFEAVDRPVTIAGTPEGKKGFGGLCFRFAPRDGGAEKTVITTDQGISKRDAVLSRHPWAQLAGTFHGKSAGARVEDNPLNPGYPKNGWLLRHGFGFLNVSYPGLQPLVLQSGKPLVLKYRVILFSGEMG